MTMREYQQSEADLGPSKVTGAPSILLLQCDLPRVVTAEHVLCGLAALSAHLHPGILRLARLQDRLASAMARLLVIRALQVQGLSRHASLNSWSKDTFGRPFLEGAPVDFSISHCDAAVVVALTTFGRVGIDVESWCCRDIDSLIPYLSARERSRLVAASDPRREVLCCWCKREALLKADGGGLSASDEDIRDVLTRERSRGGRWFLINLGDEDLCLFLATDLEGAEIIREKICLDELVSCASGLTTFGFSDTISA